MNWTQNRKEIKLISRQMYKSTAHVSVWASFVIFLVLMALPAIIRNIFTPVVDVTDLLEAYTSAADPEAISAIYSELLLELFTGRNIALMIAIFLVCTLIQGPITMGAAGFFNGVSRGQQLKITSVFSWFKNSRMALKAFWLTLLIYIIEAAFFFVLYMLPFVLLMVMGMLSFPPVIMIPIFVFSILVCLFFLLVLITRLGLAVYIMAILDCKVGKAIGGAFKITRGRTAFETFLFTLSFIGYILLCIITFGAGMIFLMPYFMTAHCIYTRRLLYRAGMIICE
ncbi:MAG: DUF975 family protein [Oscillospiraceae bacterium]|nr:DUF975 family protein [Oscillospiraceae bacterium]